MKKNPTTVYIPSALSSDWPEIYVDQVKDEAVAYASELTEWADPLELRERAVVRVLKQIGEDLAHGYVKADDKWVARYENGELDAEIDSALEFYSAEIDSALLKTKLLR